MSTRLQQDGKLRCWACGKQVKRFVSRSGVPWGKRRAAHKCPHGRRCVAGTKWGASGHNGPPVGGPFHCPGCSERERALRVPCPQCQAKVGEPCHWPIGGKECEPHLRRRSPAREIPRDC